MSIKAIRLQNFRGFKKVTLPMKRLTVLLGPNSSGKSSFGHALAAASHCQWLQGNSSRASLTPGELDRKDWPVDLGTFADLRTLGTKDRVYIGVETNHGWVDLGFGLESPSAGIKDLMFSYFEYPRSTEASGISISGGKMEAVRTSEGVPTGTLSTDQPVEAERVAVRRTNEQEWVDQSIQDREMPSRVEPEGLLVSAITHRAGTSVPLKSAAISEIRALFKDLTYLRAIRIGPSRRYLRARGPRKQLIGYGAEWMTTLLHDEGANSKVDFVHLPRIPQSAKEARATKDFSWRAEEMALSQALNRWLQSLSIASSIESLAVGPDHYELKVTLPGQQAHDITEVGLGVSQVAPVIVAGLLQSRDSVFVVDLPEAHLHPRPQADLADFFCAMALSGRSSLVETHSEMFFHRLRLRAEMLPELKDLISIYFLDASGEHLCCNPRPVGLSLDEQLHWPADFFQEGWDMQVQINALRLARKRADGC